MTEQEILAEQIKTGNKYFFYGMMQYCYNNSRCENFGKNESNMLK